jgi:heme O synthase-like polyprenyltransferase
MTLFHGFWLVAYNFLIIATLVGAVVFSVGYGLVNKWWKSTQGKNVFFYTVEITMVLLLVSLRILFGDFPGRAAFTFGLVLGLFSVVWWRTLLWLIGQVNNKKKRKDRS